MITNMSERIKILDSFLTRWPKEKLSALTLEEYIDVNNQDTFVYWLEHKTRALGSILGGDASKFGIYRRNKEPKGERKHIQKGDLYSWNRKFGNNESESFENVKANILSVISYVAEGDLDSIQDIDLADTLKWKVAFLYQDHKKPVLLNIFKKDMLRKACSNTTSNFSDLYKQLMAKRGDKNVIEYGYEIWNKLESDSEVVNDLEAEYQRDEEEALSKIETNLNTILYGPPGTGKTYSTINKALEIIEPEFLSSNRHDRAALKERFDSLVKANRIGFVTFHQSFSYEDFVEGIKASTDENNQVSYDVEDGIFKQMCDAASATVAVNYPTKYFDLNDRIIWKMSLGNTLGNEAYVYDECIKNDYIALGYGSKVDFSKVKNRKETAEILKQNGYESKNEKYDYNITSVNTFKNEMSIGDLVIISDGNHKFRAIAEISSDYYFDSEAAADEIDYCQCRKVKWLNVYSTSLPKEELFNYNLSQMSLYRLKEPTIDLEKLNSLLNSGSQDKQISSGSVVSNYKVLSVSNDLIEFEKPNGSRLPIALSIVKELVEFVKLKKITIDDIKSKRVFDKVDTKIEKYIVNGYPNLLAPLVSDVISKGIASNINSISGKRVLIIDEINRGNIANIFGELITLIEPSKRAGGDETLTVKLPYSKTPFTVPSNLYLIGTMNTADKSLAQVDIALRRRFDFIEMMTDYDVLDEIPEIEGINIKNLVETINQRIELLYDREHTIGHSFFLPLKNDATIEKLTSIFELQLLPLLEEYFFEDWERVGQVLGDPLKPNVELCFIVEKFDQSHISKLMGSEWESSGIQPYVRNDKALNNPQAYIGIYESTH